MTDNNLEGPKKHFFSMPEGVSNFTDEQMEQLANQLHRQIMEAFGEDFADTEEEKNLNPEKKEKNE